MKRFEVTWKRRLNHNMVWLKIYAPLVAKHAKPGQFIILRTDEFGELAQGTEKLRVKIRSFL